MILLAFANLVFPETWNAKNGYLLVYRSRIVQTIIDPVRDGGSIDKSQNDFLTCWGFFVSNLSAFPSFLWNGCLE